MTRAIVCHTHRLLSEILGSRVHRQTTTDGTSAKLQENRIADYSGVQYYPCVVHNKTMLLVGAGLLIHKIRLSSRHRVVLGP
jgi:hypothetical protein